MNEQISSRRRDLLKASATVGAAVYATPLMMGAASAQQTTATSSASGAMDLPNITKRRTLGSGDFRMEVSALGFGVMGMNYNRGHHPDRKAMIELLHQAAERGVTLFDTAEADPPSLVAVTFTYTVPVSSAAVSTYVFDAAPAIFDGAHPPPPLGMQRHHS